MTSPHRRCHPQQNEEDKSVMKVTVVSCKGERPSESVINVHIDGINPNANSPQIDKFMRRLTKNVVKIQNEIENQNNPHRTQTVSANEIQTDSGSGSNDIEATECGRRNQPIPTNMLSVSPACHHQNRGLHAKEVVHNRLRNVDASVNVKGNAPAERTNSKTDIVEIYSNKLINPSCDSVYEDEWVKRENSDAKATPIQLPCSRKRSQSCNNVLAQRGHLVQVYQVNPGSSRQKEEEEGDQEDTETDDLSLSTVTENKSSCSCCNQYFSALDMAAVDMRIGNSSTTTVMTGKSSNGSAFKKCCSSPKKKQTTNKTTEKSKVGKADAKGKSKGSADEESTATDTSQLSESDSKMPEDKKKDNLSEKELLEKQMALLNEKAKNEELFKKTEEQNKRIEELNRKLDELFRRNNELDRVNAQEALRMEEENAKRLESNYPGDGKNRRVRTLTKGNRTNIEAIEALLHNKLPNDPSLRNVPPKAYRRGEYPPDAYSANRPQQIQPLHGPVARGLRLNEDRAPPHDDNYSRRDVFQSHSPYSRNDPSLDCSDRYRGQNNLGNQHQRNTFDSNLDYSDRTLGSGSLEHQSRGNPCDPRFDSSNRTPGPENLEHQSRGHPYDPRLDSSNRTSGLENLEHQTRGHPYDPRLDSSNRTSGPENLENQSRGHPYDPRFDSSDRSRRPNYDFPRDRAQGIDNRGTTPGPEPKLADECEVCNSSDQDITYCCCLKKKPKSKASSRPASPQRPCKCCGQCPPHCICEEGDIAPVTLYQNAVSANIPALLGDDIFPSQALKSKDNTTLDDSVAEVNNSDIKAMTNMEAETNMKQITLLKQPGPSLSVKESKQDISVSEGLTHKNAGVHFDKSKSLENVVQSIPLSDLGQTLTKEPNVDDGNASQMLSCEPDGQEKAQTSVEGTRLDVSPPDDIEKKERFVQQMLGCKCASPAHEGDGPFSAQETKPKEKICPDDGTAERNAVIAKRDTNMGRDMPRKQRNFLKYLCACCDCKDSQETIVNSEGMLHCISGECLAKSKSLGNAVSRADLEMTKSKTSSVVAKTSLQVINCECDRQEGAQKSPEEVHVHDDPQLDTVKKEQFVKKILGCNCDGQNAGHTVQEKFANESKKGQLVEKMMACACDESRIQDFPSEVLISLENYEEQYVDDAIGIDGFPKRGPYGGHTRGEPHADGNVGGGLPRDCACEGGHQPKDLVGKQNVVERRLDRHGFGDRCDCEKKRKIRTPRGCVCKGEEADETLRKQRILEDRLGCQCKSMGDPRKMREYVSSGLSCVCSSEEAGDTLRKQRILEDRLGCSHQPVGDPRKMREYVRRGLGCAEQCDKLVEREARRKQAIVERRLNCTANHLRDTGKKSVFLKRRLDCICDDADTQAKKQQAYLERFLTCGCTNVVRDLKKKKQFVDDFLKCKCDKESEAKKMQMYLERYLSCDCEHTKERNMDKKIDYMNKVMSCDGPNCKAEKEGKELVTVCGDGTVDVAEVTRRLPETAPALGTDTLLCCCGSGDSYLGPCRCDSMTDTEKISCRRQRRRAPSSVVGGLICRCGKEGDSECVCDGAEKSTPKPLEKAKCKCRHRLDGICRCRNKTGRNKDSHRPYLINQVPCEKTSPGVAASASDGSDPILCSAKRDECNCEQDPESCFCSESSTAKPDVKSKEEDVRSEDRRTSDTSELNSQQVDETENKSDENQDEADEADEVDEADEADEADAPGEADTEVKETQIEEDEADVEDGCVCKKNCSGKCKCDIDGSDCSHGNKVRRCYCDLEGPETCICAKARSSPSQGTCYCRKDEAGLCKCDFTSKGHQRSGCKAQTKGTCHCRKDSRGQCKCDKRMKSKSSSVQGDRHSEIIIELRNIGAKPKVKKSNMEQKEENLEVESSSSIDGNSIGSQSDVKDHETQVHLMEIDQNDLFVLTKPHFDELNSESCPGVESNEDSESGNSFVSPKTSESGIPFVSSPSTSESANKLVSSQYSSESNNEFVSSLSTSVSADDLESPINESKSGSELHQPLNKTQSSADNLSESSERLQDTKDLTVASPTFSSVEDKQSEPSTTAEPMVQAGASTVNLQSVQGGPSARDVQAEMVERDTAGRGSLSTASRRPKWYNMFQLSNGNESKAKKKGKRG